MTFSDNKKGYSFFTLPRVKPYFIGIALPFRRYCSGLSIVCMPIVFTYDLLGLKSHEQDPPFEELSIYDLISIFVIVSVSSNIYLQGDAKKN